MAMPPRPEEFHTSAGLDPMVPTALGDGTIVTAAVALTAGPPSPAMHAFAGAIVDWLVDQGAYRPDAVADYQAQAQRPGGIMVRWGGTPAASEIAAAFGPIPCWLQLRPDDSHTTRYMVTR